MVKASWLTQSPHSLRNGAGPRGFLPSLSGYMLTSAATFAFFMSSESYPLLCLQQLPATDPT